MTDEDNKEFAQEIIKEYGEDRFYHASIKSGNFLKTNMLFNSLNGTDANFDKKCRELGLHLVKPKEEIKYHGIGIPFVSSMKDPQEVHFHLCKIAYELMANYKQFGLRNNKLPPNLHARLLFGEKNEWVEKYATLMLDN